MKFGNFVLGFALLALGIASAASSYNVTLSDSLWIGSTQLKAGQYKVEVQGDKAVFKLGKSVVEVPTTLGKNGQKYAYTSFVAQDSKLIEIDLGGTTAKILFAPPAQSVAG